MPDLDLVYRERAVLCANSLRSQGTGTLNERVIETSLISLNFSTPEPVGWTL